MDLVVPKAEAYCLSKRAFFILDIPESVDSQAEMVSWMETNDGFRHTNAAVYFPRLVIHPIPSTKTVRATLAPGTLAGVYARTDSTRVCWKAPAGTDADLRGARLAIKLTDGENGGLNPLGINALRNFSISATSVGVRARSTAPINSERVEVHSGASHGAFTSKKVFTRVRNGLSST